MSEVYTPPPSEPPTWSHLQRRCSNPGTRSATNLRQIHDLGWDHLSGSHGNLGTRDDIDFELVFLADMKAAIGVAMAAHPFSDFVEYR